MSDSSVRIVHRAQAVEMKNEDHDSFSPHGTVSTFGPLRRNSSSIFLFREPGPTYQTLKLRMLINITMFLIPFRVLFRHPVVTLDISDTTAPLGFLGPNERIIFHL